MLLTPATGFLGFVFTVFFVLLLWNTLAVSPDRRQLLRSLAVVFGGAFVLKFIVLASAYDSAGGLLHRVIVTMPCVRIVSQWFLFPPSFRSSRAGPPLFTMSTSRSPSRS